MCIDSPWTRRGHRGEHLIGYRAFKMTWPGERTDLRLPGRFYGQVHSLYHGRLPAWSPGPRLTDDDPHIAADYGYHALFNLTHVRHTYAARVWGRVEGWGRLAVHRTGFRASRMKILAFYLDHTNLDDAWDLLPVEEGPNGELLWTPDANIAAINEVVRLLELTYKVPVYVSETSGRGRLQWRRVRGRTKLGPVMETGEVTAEEDLVDVS